MLNKNPRYKLQEENIKPVTFAYNYVNDIWAIVESGEQRLKVERVEIENALEAQKRTLQQDINEVEAQVLEFKDNDMARKAAIYSRQIEEIQKQLAKLHTEMNHIHEQ